MRHIAHARRRAHSTARYYRWFHRTAGDGRIVSLVRAVRYERITHRRGW